MVEIIFDENEDWEKRVLCSDESCIGTIGTNGKCKECGKVYEGKLPEDHGTENSQPVNTLKQETNSPADEDNDWDKRVLCSDESCIGTIGPDGKCKECGKPGSK